MVIICPYEPKICKKGYEIAKWTESSQFRVHPAVLNPGLMTRISKDLGDVRSVIIRRLSGMIQSLRLQPVKFVIRIFQGTWRLPMRKPLIEWCKTTRCTNLVREIQYGK